MPWGDFEPESKVIPLLEATVSLAEPLVPMAGLVGQVLSKSKAAQQLLQFLSGEKDRADPSVLVWRLLRELCEEGPVACLIDDADRAGSGWWADLILSVAGRIARELPLLLVLAVEGPQALGGHQDDEPDSLFVARKLNARGLATWHSLAPLTVGELERELDAAAPVPAGRRYRNGRTGAAPPRGDSCVAALLQSDTRSSGRNSEPAAPSRRKEDARRRRARSPGMGAAN